MTFKTAFIAAILAGGLIAAPAHARTTRIATTVPFADLDLSSPQGVAVLERRVRNAVIAMCATYDRRDAVGARPLGDCIAAANVRPQVEAIVADARARSSRRAIALAAH